MTFRKDQSRSLEPLRPHSQQASDDQTVPVEEKANASQAGPFLIKLNNTSNDRHETHFPVNTRNHTTEMLQPNPPETTDLEAEKLPFAIEQIIKGASSTLETLTNMPIDSRRDSNINPSEFQSTINTETLHKRPSSIPRMLAVPDDSTATDTTPTSDSLREEANDPSVPFSVWTYLHSELTSEDFDQSYEIKSERIVNFLQIPWEFEKLMSFGYLICLNSLLHTLCILPGRVLIAIWGLFYRIVGKTSRMKKAQKSDIYKGALITICCYMLTYIEPSRLYHTIRGQSFVKLYFIFNCLEIFDKLCCSFGLDILDSLFSRDVLSSVKDKKGVEHLRPYTHFLLGLMYTFVHSMVLFYQVITLNVAINSYNNALLSLLVSNQFGEIKSNVFKRFEKENLFQLSCSDIVERFQLSVFLMIITIRNIIELSGSSSTLLPAIFFPLFPNTGSLFDSVITPVLVVFFTEYIVDWLKHAFIAKFNRIRPVVYARYVDVLACDLVSTKPVESSNDVKENSANALVDRTTAVSRRIGFANLPICCLIIRMSLHSLRSFEFWENIKNSGAIKLEVLSNFNNGGDILQSLIDLFNLHSLSEQLLSHGAWVLMAILIYTCLVAVKLIIGINLISFSLQRHTGMLEREQAAQSLAKEHCETDFTENFKASLNDHELITPLPSTLTLDTIDRYTLFKSRIP